MTKRATCFVLFLAIAGCGDDEDVTGAMNRPPAFQDQPDVTMALGDTLRLAALATDPDGQEVAYSVAVMATLAELQSGYFAAHAIDPATGDFWFYPSDRDIPSRSFEFRGEDALGNTGKNQFTVFVQR